MTLEDAMLSTLAYHGIFDYPLRISEIHNFLIGKKVKEETVKKEVPKLINARRIGEQNSFLYLKGRKSITKLRLKRKDYSQKKLDKAKFYAQVLKLIPSIKLVAVSGALAMGNSHKADDIDLVIVTAKNFLWTTRFFANILLWPFKRDPQGLKKSDRACLNLFLEESALKIKDQNLYTAHEIAQLKLLWDRNKTYSRLIKSNNWFLKYLPNWKPEKNAEAKKQGATMGSTQGRSSFKQKSDLVFKPLETILKNFQLAYMKSKITTEKIGDKQLFFHPKKTEKSVLSKYRQKLKNFGISNLRIISKA